jgi:hypothetical protein
LSAKNVTYAQVEKLIKVVVQRTLSARNVAHAKVADKDHRAADIVS